MPARSTAPDRVIWRCIRAGARRACSLAPPRGFGRPTGLFLRQQHAFSLGRLLDRPIACRLGLISCRFGRLDRATKLRNH
jgi:hypothetical protein